MSTEQVFDQDDFSKVLELTVEPMYLSEITRKLNEISEDSWNLGKTGSIVGVLFSEDRVSLEEVGYESNSGQSIGSVHVTRQQGGEREETKEWKPYTIVVNTETTVDDVRDEILEIINPSVTVGDKVELIETLTNGGNLTSKEAEAIMQDTMLRQFREYSEKTVTGYNDPEPDFYVRDEDRRQFGIHIEVTTRYDNPVGQPYVDAKLEDRQDPDDDVIILAPEIRKSVLDKYELPDDVTWHDSPENQPVHVHRVPIDKPAIYRPFAESPPERYITNRSGFPVIVPDSPELRSILRDDGHVGEGYPVVDSSKEEFRSAMRAVNRDFQGITESGYRNQLREAIEPLLWEFLRPYKIEQYLIDSYWDRGKTQNEIGRMTDVSDRTISRWMSEQKWDIVTRGRNTPLRQEILDIWKKMYRGEPPFDQIDENGLTGYEIQALYNQHPQFSLSDWRSWLNLPRETRANITSTRAGARDNVSYTVMLNDGDRLFPSYAFIINTLRENGVEIEENPFTQPGEVFPTGQAIEYMLNREEAETFDDNQPSGRELVTMKSSLEVEFAEWLSDNEVPFSYEPFFVPGMFTVEEDRFNELLSQLQNNPTSSQLNTWESIYDKHRLGSEGEVSPEEGLSILDRTRIEPDFALYKDATNEPKPADWDGWANFDSLVELGGLYGTGIVTDWENWYRASSVAHKELLYREIGLWNDVYFVIPEQEGISQAVRNDPHYLTINPTSLSAGLEAIGGVLL